MTRCFLLLGLLIISFLAHSQPATHIVAKGETLYSISKKYQVTIQSIETANSALGKDFKLKIGQRLRIPASASVAKHSKPNNTAKKPMPVSIQDKAKPDDGNIHIVIKGETMYSISKANGLSIKQLKDANHLADDMKLKLGQKLLIPALNEEAKYKPKSQDKPDAEASKPASQSNVTVPEPPKEIPAAESTELHSAKSSPSADSHTKDQTPKPLTEASPPRPIDTPHDENPFVVPSGSPKPDAKAPVSSQDIAPADYAASFSKAEGAGLKRSMYRGIARFMQNENPGNQFLALYNYAEMNSILKVTNLMSKQSIYVKVIGKVPADEAQNDVILKVSSEAATQLKVSEDKFLVEVIGYK